ncbi:transcriptional enhancer factor TEF-1 isoform X1 [Salmo salar]|uniref:Transcriptional enhancer factor TEF-1 isoform X1 n=1 Tax=Salmo salar TaxID=8030 RepID=A0A1S3MKA0_SALSA|nr:transcriptional enhancer factor TEF-1-like isoform X1 [Salmo salar]|eukprot:XP_014003529.1 PREDICTED: transcriptional enhancer factor TEF-1-like isoform X1 [Salmo salar]
MDERTATMDPSSWSGSESPADDMERMSDGAEKGMDGDPEGVWSPDIDQSFQEALAIYPPCGRRKIILSDEGKMYGRNELIARYIKLRTGKTRTRKQVSSHIQVLARRKSREFHTKLKVTCMDQSVKDKALQSMASMSSAQIVSATAIHNKLGLPGFQRPTFPGAAGFWQGMISTGQPGSSQDVKPFAQQAYPIQTAVTTTISAYEPPTAPTPTAPAWQGRSIGTTKLRLVEFSAFLEQQRDPDSYNKHLFAHIGQTNYSYSDALLEAVDIRQIYDKFPEKKGGLKELFGKGPHNSFFLVKFWADLNCNIQDDSGAFYGVTSQYESSENMTITCSTKVCSFGKQVVEKVETEYARFENGRFVYRISRSPMCEYMINFIHKLKHLPEKYMMNSVLENFTILLVVTNRETQETLLCMACVFEVSNSDHGAQHHIYRLVKE